MKKFMQTRSQINLIARAVARRTIGRRPPRPSRLTGKLAQDGGEPVRNVRYRPWANARENNATQWRAVIGDLRRVFTSGVEGIPQPLAKRFAEEWAQFCGCRFGLLLPHGTDALRIALAATLDHDGLDYGGEIIVPNFSFIASATSALDRRFGIALVDVDPETLAIDPNRVEEAIIPGKTRAIMPVHLFGQPADMTALLAIAKKHGLKIIEDAAQSHGAVWETGPVGSLGDAAAFSFQSFKNLACGEGGALTTNDEEIFNRAYSMHNVGRARINGGRWEHLTLGWNCRPTEYQAALLLYRFKTFEHEQAVRLANFKKLRQMMEDVTCLEPIAIHSGVRRHGMHMFAMRYRSDECGGVSFAEFMRAVQAEGMPIFRAYETTMAEQPVIKNLRERRPEYIRVLPTPVADQAANEVAYIAQDVFLGTEADMAEIFACVRKVEKHYAPKTVKLAARTKRHDLKAAGAGRSLEDTLLSAQKSNFSNRK